ncbi:MAG: tetratricopeptide repeat protein [Acidobacteria bacterium]|nr:tetratricopeptide repeat protein [Acidobacteriota bacterium]
MRIAVFALLGICAWAQDAETITNWEAKLRDANTAWRSVDYNKAEALYLECLREAESGVIDTYSIAVVRNNLGVLNHQRGRYKEAERMYRAALPEYEQLAGLARVSHASILSNLAETLRMQGNLDEAERLHRKGLLLAEETDKAGSTLAISLQNFAVLLNQRGRYAESRKLSQRALSLHKQRNGNLAVRLPSVLNTLAEAERMLGLDDESAAHHEESLDLRLQSLPVDHPEVATGWLNLGSVRQFQRRYAEAEECYRQAITIREARLGNDHPTLAAAHINLGTLYAEQGDLVRSENEVRLAMSLLETAGLSQSVDYGKAMENLAALFQRHEKFAGAEKLYLQALAIREKAHGAGSPLVADMYNSMARFYEVIGRKTEAGRYQKRAENLFRSFR